MTKDDKTALLRLLDLAEDALRDGYRGPARDHGFVDDAGTPAAAEEGVGGDIHMGQGEVVV